ncbi:MAG: hypothetical protein OFPII_27540 [Osedax symbiont Rs1]|nr:MAG: hypothetical protein OFPII_27540 [Osedax symbiont Rs1]
MLMIKAMIIWRLAFNQNTNLSVLPLGLPEQVLIRIIHL